MCAARSETRYFVAKVTNIPALMKCIETGQWACKDRLTPPHPREVLTEAFNSGPVIIIFSVNNCHGYHGYAEMSTAPDKIDETVANPDLSGGSTAFVEKKENQVNESNSHSEKDREAKSGCDSDLWHYFVVKWKTSFLRDFGEQCLPFAQTEDFNLSTDNGESLPLNKCRNWQEIPVLVGENVCQILESHYSSLCAKRDARLQRQLEKQEKVFYEADREESTEQTWKRIISQVEGDLGKVILACPFGSQRYNVSTPESDTDMFVVYQARTDQMLGFNPPKQTIKSSEREVCDYTIHEVHRYCELLLNGDARCVETLFLHESSVVSGSQHWSKLREGRRLLLNNECLNKYLRDAQGSKGTRYLRKWCEDNKQTDVLPPKLCKMLYVIIRLLQNARDLANGEDLQVYREIGSADRQQLMSIRAGGVAVADAWQMIDRLETEVAQKEPGIREKTEEVTKFLENWLLDIRYKDFEESRTQ